MAPPGGTTTPSWLDASSVAVGATATVAAAVALRRLDEELLLSSDLSYLLRIKLIVTKLREAERRSLTLADTWEATAAELGDKEALVSVSDSSSRTFAELDAEADAFARWLASRGFEPRDVVGLLLPSAPAFVVALLGAAKLGCAAALLGPELRKEGLLHAAHAAGCKAIVHARDGAIALAVADVASELVSAGIRLYMLSPTADAPGAQPGEGAARGSPPGGGELARRRRAAGLGPSDVCWLIFTSGTTGLPKACVLRHYRALALSCMPAAAFGLRRADRLYVALPLHHTSGCAAGIGSMIQLGCTVLLRARFSPSHLFAECARHRATALQYVGELCRFALATPPSAADRAHAVRLAFGNGLRAEVWRPFRQRFGVPEIGEFYGSTEGNIGFTTHDVSGVGPGVGAVGRAGWLQRAARGFLIVRTSSDGEGLLRDAATGRCVPCARGEAGELLGRISARHAERFEGYTDAEDTQRKIARGVRAPGDAFFRTGDLLRHSPDGYLYFVDRLGDTFRWRGENVSTAEVGAVLEGVAGVLEASVYGVPLPHSDGKACMAAVLTRDGAAPDLRALAAAARDRLPPHARPLFVRHVAHLTRTHTFKQRKIELVEEGFDPARVAAAPDGTARLWCWARERGAFEPLGESVHQRILAGEMRF